MKTKVFRTDIQGLELTGRVFTSQESTAESDSVTDGVSSDSLLSFPRLCQQPPSPLAFLASNPRPELGQVRQHGDRSHPQELARGWQCQGIFEKGEEKGWLEVIEVGEEDLPANPVKHNVIQTPVMGGGGGKRAKGCEVACVQQGQQRRGGESDKAGRSGWITDTTAQARRTGSHSYTGTHLPAPCVRAHRGP